MVDKLGWDHRYRQLASGEIIEVGDECRRDDGTWATGICVGEPAPDPAYTSHRVYRRLKATLENGEQVERADGYEAAFYSIGDMLGIGATPQLPKVVWETQMLPALRELIAVKQATPTEDARGRVKVLEEALEGALVEHALFDKFTPAVVEPAWVSLARTALGNKETDRHG